MPSPSDPEVRAFLDHSLIVLVATRSPKRRPFVTPLWFVAHGGALYITTGAETWAGKNVAQHPRLTLLFRSELGQADRLLRVRGTATCHRGFPSWPVLLRIAAKYYLSWRGVRVELRNAGRWGMRQRYYAQAKGGPGHIRVVPETCEFLRAP